MDRLQLVRFPALMALTEGRREVAVALVDGPVLLQHTDLANSTIREVPAGARVTCSAATSEACSHGTLVAGVLMARRGSQAPAICPGCTLLVRPIFAEVSSGNGSMPHATPEEVAAAMAEVIAAGANLVNLSAALTRPSAGGERRLEQVLDSAAQRGVLVVAAAGNQSTVGSSAITRHPWVIPVIACDPDGKPLLQSNLGSSIGRNGLAAPGFNITSLSADGGAATFGGTSAAAPFVTGALALLWSEFPDASAAQLKIALTRSARRTRLSIVPPLLDAWAAYQAMSIPMGRA